MFDNHCRVSNAVLTSASGINTMFSFIIHCPRSFLVFYLLCWMRAPLAPKNCHTTGHSILHRNSIFTSLACCSDEASLAQTSSENVTHRCSPSQQQCQRQDCWPLRRCISVFSLPKKPSHATLSGEHPLRDIERIRPAAFTLSSQASDNAHLCHCVTPGICPYISRHLLSLNPLLDRCRRYSRGER